jgi:hypothetical protein
MKLQKIIIAGIDNAKAFCKFLDQRGIRYNVFDHASYATFYYYAE